MNYRIILAALWVVSAATAWAEPAQSTDFNEKFQPELAASYGAGNAGDALRVIVTLGAEQPPGLSKAQAIARAQDRVLGAFTNENNGLGLAVLARYQTLFGFSAELTRGQAVALSKRGDVRYIEAMPVHEKLYTESHPLTDVDLAQGDYDGTGAVIAIIDDGIDAAHAAFSGKLLDGYDFADFDNDPTIDCSAQSHGTAVAGVALGNGPGVLGVAPGARMVFLKIQGSGICGSSSLDGDIVGAIDWATAHQAAYGIDIISMSLGGGLYSSESSCDSSSSLYFTAVQNAVDAGITVIAASGNDGMCDAMSRPACFSNVVSVGAVYDEDMGTIGWCVNRNSCAQTQPHSACIPGRAAFEDAYADNVIVYSNSAGFLDVAAPATCARSAAPNNGTVECFGGTSSATPFTSGTAALAVEAAGKGVLSPAQMRTVLVDSGDPVTDPKNGRVTPRVNGLSAVSEAATYGGGEPPANDPPTADFSFACNGLDCSFGDNSTDGDGSVVAWSWNFDDGGTSAAQNPSHAFAAAGTYDVQLTVTDDDNDSDSVTKPVSVSEVSVNDPPVASFTSSCSDLDCAFTDTSTDDDGVTSWSWNFGDGTGTSTAQNPGYTYGAAGTYTVTLTVGDGEFTDVATGSVTVSDPVTVDVELSGSATASRNKWTARVEDLNGNTLAGTWSESGTASCSGSVCTLSNLNSRKVASVIFTETITGNGESVEIGSP